MKPVITRLSPFASTRWLWVGAALSFTLLALLAAQGLPTLDNHPLYTPQQAQAILTELLAHKNWHLFYLLDFFFPPVYAITLVWAIQRAQPNAQRPFCRLCALPLAAWVADWGENGASLGLLTHLDEAATTGWQALAWLACGLTALKWALVAGSALALAWVWLKREKGRGE